MSAKPQLRRGSVLALALMMTMLILMAGIGVGLIVVEGSRRAVESDQAVEAYYMADAGIERQMYGVRKSYESLATLSGLGKSYSNLGTWDSATGLIYSNTKKFNIVPQNQFAVIDLFDPDNASTPSPVCKLAITWTDDPVTCTGAMHAKLEGSYGYWDIIGGVPRWPTDNQFVVVGIGASDEGNQSLYAGAVPPKTFDIPGLSTSKAYRIRLRAFECNAKDVAVQAFAPGGTGCDSTSVSFPGDITLSAQGNYKLASQKITVTMPKQDVLSGIFSYVIFSECQIRKDGGTTTCPP